MRIVILLQIYEHLKLLPPEKLAVVYDFVGYLTERELQIKLRETPSEAYQVMFATEKVLHREWDSSEEDQAWAGL